MNNYDLITNFPKKNLSACDENSTLETAGIHSRDTLYVQQKNWSISVNKSKSHFSSFDTDWNCSAHFAHLFNFPKVAQMLFISSNGLFGCYTSHVDFHCWFGPNNVVSHRWHWNSCSWNPPFFAWSDRSDRNNHQFCVNTAKCRTFAHFWPSLKCWLRFHPSDFSWIEPCVQDLFSLFHLC